MKQLMNKRRWTVILLLSTVLVLPAQHHRLAWGDQGNGTYINPVLNADYSDPDVIRVGQKYYMVASDFHFVGMQILESNDLLNWRIVTQVYHRFDHAGWNENKHYAGGSWAPAIRYHDGRYWIYFCTPDEGLFMTQAEHPEGPWSPLHLVKAVEKWEDPCPFWDDDGQAYLGRSQHGAGPIIVHKMSSDGRRLLDDGVTVYQGPVAEGTKFLKRNGWYYLSIPEGGVGRGWQTVLRSKNIYGPYERRRVLEQGSTAVNGPHQGAIVDTPQGNWWFFHFQHSGALGRVLHLQPMYWKDDWPVIGVDIDRNGVGEPVTVWTTPYNNIGTPHQKTSGKVPEQHTTFLPQTSDDFNAEQLSPQWQWNHNAADEAWSLTERRGWLTLHALKAKNFMEARNTLTQKTMGYESEVTMAIDVSGMAEDGFAGLVCMGKTNRLLGMTKKAGKPAIYIEDIAYADKEKLHVNSNRRRLSDKKLPKKLYLRLSFDMPKKEFRFSYSHNGKAFKTVGEPFFIDFGYWKGVRFGIYHYNEAADSGSIGVDWVKYDVKR